jgi:hypothetical protein
MSLQECERLLGLRVVVAAVWTWMCVWRLKVVVLKWKQLHHSCLKTCRFFDSSMMMMVVLLLPSPVLLLLLTVVVVLLLLSHYFYSAEVIDIDMHNEVRHCMNVDDYSLVGSVVVVEESALNCPAMLL